MHYLIVEPRSFNPIVEVANEVEADKWVKNNIHEVRYDGHLCLIELTLRCLLKAIPLRGLC